MAWIEERPTESGESRFRVVIRKKGHRTTCGTFPNITKAKLWAKQTESAMEEGRYSQISAAKRHSLKELIERYEKDHLPHKTKAKQGFQFKWWKNQIGHLVLSDVTPAVVAEYRDKLRDTPTPAGKPRSPASVVRYLAALSHICTVAVKEYGWMNENPVLKVTKPKEPRGRIRFLDDDERKRLLEACQKSENKFLYTIVVLSLATGMRQAETLSLKWGKNVDLENEKIVLHETKNGERRVVPLKGLALELLRKLRDNRKVVSELVFPGGNPLKPISFRSAWKFALQRANIKGAVFHTLRHSAASYLVMNGASLMEVAEILGHKTLQMVKRYAHLSEPHVSSVVERMNEKILGQHG